MDLMALRRRILTQQPGRYIGGLIVLMDNVLYKIRDYKWDEQLVEDSNYFLTGWYDSGSTGSKSYSARVQPKSGNNGAYIRYFNDKTATSYDYWAITEGESYDHDGVRTFSTGGRYVIASIYKPYAADSYLYDNTNGIYIYKGKNVT